MLNSELLILEYHECQLRVRPRYYHHYRHNEYIYKRVMLIQKEANSWVLFINDIPVSLSGFNTKLSDAIQIEPVWTPPEYRCRSYARILVAMTLNQAKEYNIKKAVLFTNNAAAVRAYKAIGFKKAGYYRLALLAKPITWNKKRAVIQNTAL